MTIILMTLSGGIVWRIMSLWVRRQSEEVRRAKEEARRAEAAKTGFLANISHEIRTPIHTIMGMNELAMREDATGVPKAYVTSMMNYSYDIRNASEALLALVNDLIDMSKFESGEMRLAEQEYDVRDLLRYVISLSRVRSEEKALAFDADVDELLPRRLYGDQSKIKQVVLNLLTNSVKYTEVGGVTFTVSMTEREDDTCKLVFSVKDTGMGMTEEIMAKMFATFEHLDEMENGEVPVTGIGLDISYRIAKLLGGNLDCESTYGEGTMFSLTVTQKIVDDTPLGDFSEEEDRPVAEPYMPKFVAPDADILVVDEDPILRTVVRGLLKGTRVFVSTVGSVEECLDKVRDTKFNVIFLDAALSEKDGEDTLAKIHQKQPELPVYALVTDGDQGEDFYQAAGFAGYLMKPVDGAILEETIMKHLPETMMEKTSRG